MSRIQQEPEKIFKDIIYKSIENIFIKNPNYSNGEYGYDPKTHTLIRNIKQSALFLLDEIDSIKHLINLDKDDKPLYKLIVEE